MSKLKDRAKKLIAKIKKGQANPQLAPQVKKVEKEYLSIEAATREHDLAEKLMDKEIADVKKMVATIFKQPPYVWADHADALAKKMKDVKKISARLEVLFETQVNQLAKAEKLANWD